MTARVDGAPGVASPEVRVRPPTNGRAGGRTRARRRVRRVDPWIEVPAVAAGTVVLGAFVLVLVRAQSAFWLPIDAAHSLSEADYLRGDGVITYSHPPAFPALVVAWDVLVGRYDAVLAALCTAVACFGAALYALTRRWFDPLVAATAALVGTLLPVVAEAIGWGGAPSMLGNAAALGALAATDAWCRAPAGRREKPVGWLVGLLLGVTMAAHPFSFVVGVFLCGGRVLAEVVRRRTVAVGGWGPTSIVGWLTVLTATAPFVLVSETYYTRVRQPGSTTIGWPELRPLTSLVSWSTREGLVFLLLTIAGFAVPVVTRVWSLRVVSSLLVVVVVGLPVVVHGDADYQSRALYFAPALVALVVALGFRPATDLVARLLSRSRRASELTLAVVTVAFVVLFGFDQRLATAVSYYERIDRADLSLLEDLGAGDGVVAASHAGHEYAVGMHWLVNGVARRPALSPSAPWYSTSPSEIRDGRAMQQLFSGQVGVEDGAVQVAAWGAGSTYGLTISVRVDDFYFPIAHLDPNRTELPVAVRDASATVTADTVTLTLSDPGVVGAVTITATLRDGVAALEAHMTDGSVGDWHLVFTPPRGLPWRPLRRSAHVVELDQAVRGRSLTTLLRTRPSGATGAPVVRAYGEGLPVDVDARRTTAVAFGFDVRGDVAAHDAVTSFDERALLERYGISQVVVWLDSGTRERFARPCFQVAGESDRLVVLDVGPDCGA